MIYASDAFAKIIINGCCHDALYIKVIDDP